MKKFATVFTAVLVSAAIASPAFGQGISVGPKVGVNFANIGGDVEGTDMRTGLSAGLMLRLDIPLSPIGIQAEGLYSMKGAKEGEGDAEVTTKLDYFEVPVLAVFSPPVPSPIVHPHLLAGPAVAFELSCKEGDLDCADGTTKSVDFGLVVGGGADFSFGPGMLTIDGRYNVGLSNLNDVPDTDFSVKNRTWQIMAGYMFRLGA